MVASVRQLVQSLRESFWFVPGLLLLVSLAMAYGLVAFDARTDWRGGKQFPLLFGNGADGARGMLSAIAGSMLTVATLTFSLTLSAITQVSSQYSPRVLRNFMRDRANQLVMGYFVGVFAYCLVVLGTIRGADEGKFVPATAVLVGLVLALGGVVALIFFIHHITESLQTGTVVAHIFEETQEAIETLFPQQLGEGISEPPPDETTHARSHEMAGWWPLRATQTGYLQRLDTDGLMRWADDHRAMVRIERTIGTFITPETRLFSVLYDLDKAKTDKSDRPAELMVFVSLGRHRSIDQDVAFGLQQLVDIILKALSPGINDTTTAIMAIDFMGALMSQLAGRSFLLPLRTDGQQVRVRVETADFADYARLAFDLPRINAKANHAVFGRLLHALAGVGNAARSRERQAVVAEQARLLLAYADQTLDTPYEQQSVRALYADLQVAWS